MKLQEIVVGNTFPSKTNVKGRIEGKDFDDLVASIKEKGVLQPVLARRMKDDKGSNYIEVIAGNRRLEAARKAGLKFIPAQVVEMTDVEAREAQIIENLQREDIHPLDEGEQYRELIEESKYEIPAVAAKVGKEERYIKQRLFLTNLTEKSANAYRNGKFTDGHAVLMAKLSSNDQSAALKYVCDRWNTPSVKELKEWIEAEFYNILSFQPWLKDEEAMKAVGKCRECQPNTSSLFGDVKEGACTDLKCWKRKMGKYIDYRVEKEKESGGTLVKITKEYDYTSQKNKRGVLIRNNYEMLSTKKKHHCASAQKAIVAEDKDLGTIVWICADPECKEHGKNHSSYELTPKEIAKRKEERKKELDKEKEKKEKEAKEMSSILALIKDPILKSGSGMLDIILDLVLVRNGEQYTKPVCHRHRWEAVKVGRKGWGMNSSKVTMFSDWEKTIRENYAKLTEDGKFRLIIEIMLETAWDEPKKRIIGMIKSLK